MALKDTIPLGLSLPHRSPEPIDMEAVRWVAQRAEALGFRDLWVTENTLDHVFCFDPVVVLTYAAAVTKKIRVGSSVVVLPVHNPIHVAHQWATLDYVSGGRTILGVGLGRDHHYEQFQTSTEGRVRRFREGVELIRALWTKPRVNYRGRIFRLGDGTMAPKPVQKPHPPLGRDLELAVVVLAAEAEAENGPSVADVIETGPLMRDHQRAVDRQHHDGGAEPDLAGDRRSIGEDDDRIETEDVVERVLGHPQIAETERLGALRHQAHVIHVDRLRRAVRQRQSERYLVRQRHSDPSSVIPAQPGIRGRRVAGRSGSGRAERRESGND